jgi:hypothetical protein
MGTNRENQSTLIAPLKQFIGHPVNPSITSPVIAVRKPGYITAIFNQPKGENNANHIENNPKRKGSNPWRSIRSR